MSRRALEPVVAPEQLGVDRDRGNADDAQLVRRVGRLEQGSLDLCVLRRRLELIGVESGVRTSPEDVLGDAQVPSQLKRVAKSPERELAPAPHVNANVVARIAIR